MKKLIILMLALVVLFCTVGCNDKKANTITCTREKNSMNEVIELTFDKNDAISIIKIAFTSTISDEKEAKALAESSKAFYDTLKIDFEYSIADGKMTSIVTFDINKLSSSGSSLLGTMVNEIETIPTKDEVKKALEGEGYKC